MKRFTSLFLAVVAIALWAAWPPQQAQSGFCNQSTPISVAAANTQTIAAAIPGSTVKVCAYDLSVDTIATTATISSSGTALTGAMRFCDECVHAVGDGNGILLEGIADGSLTITAATGAIRGWVRWGR